MKKLLFPFLTLAFLGLLFFGVEYQARSAPAEGCDDLFFSEYIEGSSYNKALEIYNASSHPVDLSDYQVVVSFDGGASERRITLTGTLASGDVYVLAHGRADPAILALADVINSYVINFNGNDAVILKENGAIIDVIGRIGENPGDFWDSEPVTTRNHTLRRKPTITAGDANGADAFDPAIEWNGYPVDDFDDLGRHTAGCNTPGPQVAIHDIQAAGHLSPYRGMTVSAVPGVATAVASRGFYMQTPDAEVDEDAATSEGIYVYASRTPGVAVGDAVAVTGMVTEYYPGGTARGYLSTTEINLESLVVLAHDQPLPAATIIGQNGRMPPTEIIENDASGSVNNTGVFDPDQDGIDFYESLEGMRVQVEQPLALGPTSSYGEIPVIGDGGVWGGVYADRGALVVRPEDSNPERLIIDDALVKDEPKVNVGDRFDGSITGVLDYSYGNFKLLNTQPLPAVIPGHLTEESAASATEGQLSVAAMNVENLDPGDPDEKFTGLASDIVNHLLSPDIISLEEVQDNDGKEDDGVVAADQTYGKLIDAIRAAGGPGYAYRDIPPEDKMDGGQPGGNIRVGFLFRPDRVHFVDRPGGDATTAVSVLSGADGPELSFSPGRVDPTNAAWEHSRKPLAGEFVFNGHTVFVISNHFNSKGGDDALFGRYQPPRRPSEAQRWQQARVINNFVAQILAVDPHADVIALGDLNDFWFSAAVKTLQKDGVLTNLIEQLPESERYTYLYQGNAQTLDHVLVSPGLLDRDPQIDIVHANAEFAQLPERATDHDPVLARFDFGPYLMTHRVWLPSVLR